MRIKIKSGFTYFLLVPVISGLLILMSSCGRVNENNWTNVILITIDTLRADHLGCYGYSRNTSKFIDELSGQGVIFKNTFSQVNSTNPSHTSILTSTYVREHGVINNDISFKCAGIKTIAQRLKENGYTTCAVVSAFHLNREHSGLGNGYDSYFDVKIKSQDQAGEESKITRKAEETTEIATKWLKQNKNKKIFMWIHYFDPHTVYNPPPPFNTKFVSGLERRVKLLIDIYYHKITPEQALSGIENPEPGLISLYKKTYDHIFPLEELTYNTARLTNAEQNNFIDFYDGEIAYTDYCLGKFFESIDKLKLRDKTLVILTADHGESLGEHEIFANHVGIYNQQLYIPLIMRYPPKIKPGTVVESLVQSIDIVPTILNILNIPIDAAIRGKSLVELFDNQNKVLHECIYAEHANLVAVARIDRDWKYILPRRENESLDPTIYRHKTAELYNRQNDNAEKLNLGDSQPDMQISLDADVKKWENEVGMNKEALAHGTHEKLEPQVREGLKALGYIN